MIYYIIITSKKKDNVVNKNKQFSVWCKWGKAKEQENETQQKKNKTTK